MPRKLPRMKTPVEERLEQEQKMTFSERYEEELKQQLFKETVVTKDLPTAEDILTAKTIIHKERPDEE